VPSICNILWLAMTLIALAHRRLTSSALHAHSVHPVPRFPRTPPMAPLPMSVTFLGTSSGGGPSDSRNCSSLVVDVHGDGSLWSALLLL